MGVSTWEIQRIMNIWRCEDRLLICKDRCFYQWTMAVASSKAKVPANVYDAAAAVVVAGAERVTPEAKSMASHRESAVDRPRQSHQI